MKTLSITKTAAAVATIAFAMGGCANWNNMDKDAKGTTVGGATGAVAGAVVGGPVGAVVGGGVGAYVGHETSEPGRATASNSTTTSGYDSSLVRSVQQALNDRGYSVGAVDGQWGPATEDGVRRFQQASGLPATGDLGRPTLSALGLASRDTSTSPTRATQ